jgi:hypothetical protein
MFADKSSKNNNNATKQNLLNTNKIETLSNK